MQDKRLRRHTCITGVFRVARHGLLNVQHRPSRRQSRHTIASHDTYRLPRTAADDNELGLLVYQYSQRPQVREIHRAKGSQRH